MQNEKKPATFVLRRDVKGGVSARIVDINGNVEVDRNFGLFTDTEYSRLLDQVRVMFPDLTIDAIEIDAAGN